MAHSALELDYDTDRQIDDTTVVSRDKRVTEIN